MDIGDRIAELRRRKSLTQQELADRLYVSRQLVSKWESGDRRPDYKTVEKIAQIGDRVQLLTNLRRKMSNIRDRRRKGVICPGQSGTGRSQNTFFTETGKEPVAISILP